MKSWANREEACCAHSSIPGLDEVLFVVGKDDIGDLYKMVWLQICVYSVFM